MSMDLSQLKKLKGDTGLAGGPDSPKAPENALMKSLGQSFGKVVKRRAKTGKKVVETQD